MPPTPHAKLANELRQTLRIIKPRAECFSAAAIAVVQTQSVRLADIAAHLPGEASADSKFRRMRRFFLQLSPNYEAVARFILGLLHALLDKKPLILAMDRTTWKARGNDASLLVMNVCLGDAGQPVIWTDLHHPGSSNTNEYA